MPFELAQFYRATRAADKVIVVELGFLGDTVHLIPALWEIKAHYPTASLQVCTSPLGADLLRLAPCVDRLWSVVLDPECRSWREHWAVIRRLRQERFDVAFSFGSNDRAIILMALAGARWRLAHQTGRHHFWHRWITRCWVPRRDRHQPVFEQRRQVLAVAGFSLQAARFDLRLAETDRQWAETAAPPQAMHWSLNSANPLKEWPVEHYVTLAQQVWKQYPDLPVLVSATAKPREQARMKAFLDRVADPRARPLPATMSIGQLAAVVSGCRLHMGPDSGVVHLAMALGVPTVSLIRDQPGYEEWLPAGQDHQHLAADCPCADHRLAPCERLGHAECLARISPEMVWPRIRLLLSGQPVPVRQPSPVLDLLPASPKGVS